MNSIAETEWGTIVKAAAEKRMRPPRADEVVDVLDLADIVVALGEELRLLRADLEQAHRRIDYLEGTRGQL
jgi:hypothetical protein